MGHDSIKKPTPEPQGIPHQMVSQIEHRHSQHSINCTQTTPHIVASSLCTLMMAARARFGKLLVNSAETGPNLQAKERTQISALALPLEKQKGSCQHPAWWIAGSRESIKAQEVFLKEEQEVRCRHIHRSSEKASESIVRLMEDISLLKSVSKDWNR